jgi:hypothetical protein
MMQIPNSTNIPAPNPLTAFMRQPKIYITLPSQGRFWPTGSIVMPENQQIPVYSMTARDELALKVPDALLNGQAVVDVIQNCIPNIADAWQIPSIDLDYLLIAIRIATYGEIMTTPVKFTDDVEFDYQVDLRVVLDNLTQSVNWHPAVAISENMTIFVKPLNYAHMTQAAVQAFETQRIMQAVNDENLDSDQKVTVFQNSFQKITQTKLAAIQHSIDHIDTSAGSTANPDHIREFVAGMDSAIFNQIQAHLEAMAEQNRIKPMTVAVTDEMRELGITGDQVQIPLIFDPATFFA